MTVNHDVVGSSPTAGVLLRQFRLSFFVVFLDKYYLSGLLKLQHDYYLFTAKLLLAGFG